MRWKMIRRFDIRLTEKNLDKNLNPIEVRQFAITGMSYFAEDKSGHLNVLKNAVQELIDFYKLNENLNNFKPYKRLELLDKLEIAELEKENEKLQKELKKYSSYKTDDERIKGLQDVCGQWAKENAKLKEQLKNAIVPKFKMGQEVWFISDPDDDEYRHIQKIKIDEISISSLFKEREIMYAGDDWGGISEKDLFTTEAEAQKHLDKISN